MDTKTRIDFNENTDYQWNSLEYGITKFLQCGLFCKQKQKICKITNIFINYGDTLFM